MSKDLKGNSLLTANRIVAKKYGIPLPESDQYEVPYKKTATLIRDFLRDAPIVLKKSSVAPWQDTSQYRLLDPRLSPAYFGILDTLHVHTKEGVIQFVNNKDIDIVSLKLNGKSVLDQIDSKKKRAEEDILLDTGLNIMTFFADDYGNNPPSTAAINLTFGKKNISLDFAAKQNLASTCIILKIYYDEDPAKNTKFQSNSFDGNFETATSQNNYNKLNNKSKAQLSRQTKILGDLVSSSKQIVLAIWDDAVEDGDSISISVNGEWITQGFAVKKKPQFLNIFLAPGPNQITFVADNLGSIVPNTAVLEIIDGKKRKSFNIETDMDINNKVKIFYDINQ